MEEYKLCLFSIMLLEKLIYFKLEFKFHYMIQLVMGI